MKIAIGYLLTVLAAVLISIPALAAGPARHGHYELPVVTFSVTSGPGETAEIIVDNKSEGYVDSLTYKVGGRQYALPGFVQPGTRRSARFSVPAGAAVSYCTSVQPAKGGVTEPGPAGFWRE